MSRMETKQAPYQNILCGPVLVSWLHRDKESDDIFDAALFDEEKLHAQTLLSKVKRSEFIRSRWLIRELAEEKIPLPTAAEGYPIWPEPYIGSISHSVGHVAVTLFRSPTFRSVGIDLERVSRMKTIIEPRILEPEESILLNNVLSDQSKFSLNHSREFWLTVIFGFKESCFKCLFPLVKKRFYFHDVNILKINCQESTIEARIKDEEILKMSNIIKVMGYFYGLSYRGEILVFSSVVV